MSPTNEFLNYGEEDTQAAPLVDIQISQEWLPFVLGACDILAEREVWHPDTDDEDVQYMVNDLFVRLMGEGFVGSGFGGGLPHVIPATALYWYAAVNATKEYNRNSEFLNQRAFSDDTDANRNLSYFAVWLEPGTYVFEVVYSKNTNRGKFLLQDNQLDLDFDTVDSYATGQYLNVTATGELVVEEARKVSVEIIQVLSNPASSANYVVLNGIIIRHKHGEE